MNIIGYDQYTENNRCEIGNKAANVSILHQKGYNVPAGFVLTVSFLQDIADISLDRAELTSSFRILKPPLAVRSSAVDEDSHDRSFAGIFDSVLNVMTQDQYISAIKSVCGSASAAAYKSYTSDGRPKMAILVQEFVPADHAGVIFTANPVNNNHSEIVVEYFSGLGISVVGGKTTPHHLIIDKNSRKVKDFIKSGGGMACFPGPSGGYRETFLNEEELTFINEEMISKLVKTSIELEMLFGCPQDIEWAVVNDKLFVLQARPVTGLSGEGR